MAFETKVLLRSLADSALLAKNKQMYRLVANLANVEGVLLKPYDEAIKDMGNDND